MFYIYFYIDASCWCFILIFILMPHTNASYWCLILMPHIDALYWCVRTILMRSCSTDAPIQYWYAHRILMRLYNINAPILYCSKISIWDISMKALILYKRINILRAHQYCTNASVLYKRINMRHQYEALIWDINIKHQYETVWKINMTLMKALIEKTRHKIAGSKLIPDYHT